MNPGGASAVSISRMRSWLRVFAALLALAVPAAARAHGRPITLGQFATSPSDPHLLVVRGTFGLLTSRDDGESWRWTCARSVGFDPVTEDPRIVLTPDGSLLAGTFDGLSRSSPGVCAFSYPEALLTETYIVDVLAQPGASSTIWAVSSPGTTPDRLFRSTDEGMSFAQVGAPIPDVLIERIVVAPSDPRRVYMSGADPTDAMGERVGYLLRSMDGGESFESTRVDFAEGERNVHVLAVDPNDPDRLFVRIRRQPTLELGERLLLSIDGGRSFTTVLDARRINTLIYASDGTLYAASAGDGLFRSTNNGDSFESVLPGLTLTCVGEHQGAIWVCAERDLDGFVLGRSTDHGQTLDRRIPLTEMGEMIDCPRCSPVGIECPAWQPDIVWDFRLDFMGSGVVPTTGAPRDAGLPPECREGYVPPVDDGGTMDGGTGREGAGCGCGVSRRRLPAAETLIAACVLLGLRRRRRNA